MQKVLTAEQMRTVDRLTTERYGIPSILLMENAAHAVARVIEEKLGGSVKDRRILILCGKGNNGGDGAALARILNEFGARVEVYVFGKIEDSRGDARANFERLSAIASTDLDSKGNLYLEAALHLDYWVHTTGAELGDFDVAVDAIFGTGLNKHLHSGYGGVAYVWELRRRDADAETNTDTIRLSIDIPSGLFSDDANEPKIHLESDVTVTFTAPKTANILPSACRSNGDLVIADIGSPQELIDEQSSQLYLAEVSDAEKWLKESEFSSSDYKNKRGHALVIAGSESYSGAAVLAGNAAMRSGVGLVTLAVPAAIRSEVAARALPDLIVRPFDDGGEVDFAADAVLIGCGLDANDSANEAMFRKVVEERTTPVIVDAGGLWFFHGLTTDSVQPPATAGGSDGMQEPLRVSSPHVSEGSPQEESCEMSPLILTPHEGEFRRLLSETKNHPVGETPPPLLGKEGSLKEDRVGAVREYAVANNVILVLKGERVLIGAPDGRVVVNPTGNSGLGKAGNGDTLAGILAGFVAQAVKFEIDIFDTVVAAVYVAGMAGDMAEKKYGKRVMTASDVRECLVDVFAELNAK